MDTSSGSGQQPSPRLNPNVKIVFESVVWSFILCIVLLFGLAVLDSAVLRYTGFVALGVFLVLSFVLLYLTAKSNGPKTLRVFLYLTGSAGGIFTPFLLLSLLFELLRAQFNIELSPGQDGGWIGATMFMLALFFCPAILVTGIIGTTVMLIGRKAKG